MLCFTSDIGKLGSIQGRVIQEVVLAGYFM